MDFFLCELKNKNKKVFLMILACGSGAFAMALMKKIKIDVVITSSCDARITELDRSALAFADILGRTQENLGSTFDTITTQCQLHGHHVTLLKNCFCKILENFFYL